MKSGAQLVRQKKEKSAAILVTIIVVFLLCHIHRLSLRLYEMASPESSIYEHYRYCDKKGCLKSILKIFLQKSFQFLYSFADKRT